MEWFPSKRRHSGLSKDTFGIYVVELKMPKSEEWSLSDLIQDMKLFEVLAEDNMYHDSWIWVCYLLLVTI